MNTRRKHGFGWRVWFGLLAGAYAGAAELHKRDKRIMIFDAPRAEVTVIIARGSRGQEIRERIADMLHPEAVAAFDSWADTQYWACMECNAANVRGATHCDACGCVRGAARGPSTNGHR